MFARVITAQAGAEGFDGTIRLAEQQLPGARQQPGFKFPVKSTCRSPRH